MKILIQKFHKRDKRVIFSLNKAALENQVFLWNFPQRCLYPDLDNSLRLPFIGNNQTEIANNTKSAYDFASIRILHIRENACE